ncbi:MAG: head GIN domain-containing protein [Sphingomicrobium sp.]
MRKAVLMGIVAASTATAGCGQGHDADAGPTVQKSYQVGNFTQVEVAGPFDVTIHTGAAPSVNAKGNQKLIDRLVVEVKGDKLVIHPESSRGWFHWGWGTNGSADIAITVPAISGATLAGSGGISIDTVKGDSFEGSVAGSGDLDIDSLDVKDLKFVIAGSGDVRAKSGQTGSAAYKIMGSGGIDARSVRAQTAQVSIAGSGSIRGQATTAADVEIMGSGDVALTGGAKCNVTKHGSGDVSCS